MTVEILVMAIQWLRARSMIELGELRSVVINTSQDHQERDLFSFSLHHFQAVLNIRIIPKSFNVVLVTITPDSRVIHEDGQPRRKWMWRAAKTKESIKVETQKTDWENWDTWRLW